MKYSAAIPFDDDDDDQGGDHHRNKYFSDDMNMKEYHCLTGTMATPWRRLWCALGQCWEEHNSCLVGGGCGAAPHCFTWEQHHHQHRQCHYNCYEDSIKTALLSTIEEGFVDDDPIIMTNYNQNNINNSNSNSAKPNVKHGQEGEEAKTKMTTSWMTMDKDGIFFMAPTHTLLNHHRRRPPRRIRAAAAATWMLPFGNHSHRRPIPLHDDDDDDDDYDDGDVFGAAADHKTHKVNNVRSRSRKKKNRPSRPGDDENKETFWPRDVSSRQQVQQLHQHPRSSPSAFHQVMTKIGSSSTSSGVECMMMTMTSPPEPSLCSIPGDSCSSSLSSSNKEDSSSSHASSSVISAFLYGSETATRPITTTKTTTKGENVKPTPTSTTTTTTTTKACEKVNEEDDEDEDDPRQKNLASILYPQSLTRGWKATAATTSTATTGKANTSRHLTKSNKKGDTTRTTTTTTTTNNNNNNDDDDAVSTEGSCYSIPTLTVSYEDDVAQLAVAFSTSSLRGGGGDTDTEDETEDEDDENVGGLTQTTTMGLHHFTLGANFSHPSAAASAAVAVATPVAQYPKPTPKKGIFSSSLTSSLLPPPPPPAMSPTSSINSSSSKSSKKSFKKSSRHKIGIAFPHPWYASKLLQIPKRDVAPELPLWPLQREQQQQPQREQLQQRQPQQLHQQQRQQQREEQQAQYRKEQVQYRNEKLQQPKYNDDDDDDDDGKRSDYLQQPQKAQRRHATYQQSQPRQQQEEQQWYAHAMEKWGRGAHPVMEVKEAVEVEVEERDERDVWSMVESDPLEGDMTDPPTPVLIEKSKVWSPNGWSSSSDDEHERDGIGRFKNSPLLSSSSTSPSSPSPWKWPKPQSFFGKLSNSSNSSSSARSWEELPPDNDDEDGDESFIVRRSVTVAAIRCKRSSSFQKSSLERRHHEPTRPVESANNKQGTAAVYSPRLAYPPLQPLFMNS